MILGGGHLNAIYLTSSLCHSVYLFFSWFSLLVFENGDYSYKVVLSSEDERTWYESEHICQQNEGGHLASISSEDENRFLNEKIQLLSGSKEKPEQLWIGAVDEEIYGEFHWANGQKFE